MNRGKLTVAAALTAALVAIPSPAQAQRLTITDSERDAGSGLNIVGAVVKNGDRAVTITTSFKRVVRGDLIVGLKARGGGRAVAVSQHRPQGVDKTFLYPKERTCRGLSAEWDADAGTATIRVPSRCLRGGDYGAVKVFILTEKAAGGSDVDYAPETPDGNYTWTSWIPRG